MPNISKLLLAVVLAGSLALAAIGIVHAQTSSTSTVLADTQVAAPTVTDTTSTDLPSTTAPLARTERHQARLDDLATLFNLSSTDLQTEMSSGKPLYQIAAEHGVTYDTMKTDKLAQLKTKLDDMVKVGYMTQPEADQIYQQAQSQPMMGLGFGHGMHWMK
ncbi:MAG: hypothetical protein WC544_00725 [Patescibacteria group bacterium]